MDGDIFFIDDADGILRRLAVGSAIPEPWVSAWPDDPAAAIIDLDIAPRGAPPGPVAPGEGVAVDTGIGGSGDPRVWTWSPERPESALLLVDEQPDWGRCGGIVAAAGGTYVLNQIGNSTTPAYQVRPDGSLRPVRVTRGAFSMPHSITLDSQSNELLIGDANDKDVQRTHAISGDRDVIFSNWLVSPWLSLAKTPILLCPLTFRPQAIHARQHDLLAVVSSQGHLEDRLQPVFTRCREPRPPATARRTQPPRTASTASGSRSSVLGPLAAFLVRLE